MTQVDDACRAVQQAIRDAHRNPAWSEAKKHIDDAIHTLIEELDTGALPYAKALAEEASLSLKFCTEASDLEIVNLERETEAIRNIARRDA